MTQRAGARAPAADFMEIEMKRLFALAPVLVLLAGPTLAQQIAATGDAATAQLNRLDRQFLDAASTGGLAEVAAARIAEEHASKDPVKVLARSLITDNNKANEELTALAGEQGIAAPTEPGKKQKVAVNRLKVLGGDAFDRAYVRDEIKDHKTMIALFRKEAESGQDPKLKAFASQTLPSLQRHLQMAQKIAVK
jgi:putative membrane protein